MNCFFTQLCYMKVLILTATKMELSPLLMQLKFLKRQFPHLQLAWGETGVGMLNSCLEIMHLCSKTSPNWVIQAGIAGSFLSTKTLGKTFAVEAETLGDTGVWEKGKWLDIFDLNLISVNKKPFVNKQILNKKIGTTNLLKLPLAKSLSVNQITTGNKNKLQLKKKYGVDIENMEGISAHMVCNYLKLPFIQLRTVSNLVGERDKSKWKMQAAINDLNITLVNYLDALNKKVAKTK